MTDRSMNVLLVEDEPAHAEAIRRAFPTGRDRVELRVAGTLQEYRLIIATSPPDIAILDLNLPDGRAVQVLAAPPETNRFPVLIMTSFGDEQTAVEAMKAGALDYIVKSPEAFSTMPRIVDRALREWALLRARRQDEARIRHLNSVLRGIRNVNQLIVREKDVETLIRRSCEVLTEDRGYVSAWIALYDDSGKLQSVASAGLGEAFEPLADHVRRGRLAGCSRALRERGVHIVRQPGVECPGCPAASQYGNQLAIAVRLEYEGRVYGLLVMSMETSLVDIEEERNLIEEVADDIAFALHSLAAEEQRKRAVRELQESEQLMDAIIENIPLMIFLKGAEDLRFVLFNRAGEELLGYDRKDLIGRNNLDLFPPEQAAHFMAKDREVLAEGMFLDIPEEPILTAKKDTRLLHTRKVCIKGVDGVTKYLLGISEDITERKQAEAERERLQASLAQSDRLASMGTLAAGVAHEINNPLSYVLYNVESAVEDLPRLAEWVRRCHDVLAGHIGHDAAVQALGGIEDANAPAAMEDVISRLREAASGAERIKQIARGLSTFSRVDRDEMVPVAMQPVIEQALSMASNQIKYRARVVKDFSRVPSVLASDGKLAQVFLNLFVNAAHAIEEGHVEQNEIRVRTWAEGDAVFAEVRDTGRGISPEHRDRVFEPFFTTKEIGVGSGLGLSITKNIITGFGGEISFTSDVGTGTRFLVRLPRLPRDWQSGEMATPADATIHATARGRILVVDDEPGIRATIVRMLGRDHDVVTTASGEEGQALLEKDRRFDLIFCDLMMPRISGMELHAWLTERDAALAGQVVFITGGAFTPGASSYLARVGNLRVEKPFDTIAFRKLTDELILAARAKRGA